MNQKITFYFRKRRIIFLSRSIWEFIVLNQISDRKTFVLQLFIFIYFFNSQFYKFIKKYSKNVKK